MLRTSFSERYHSPQVSSFAMLSTRNTPVKQRVISAWMVLALVSWANSSAYCMAGLSHMVAMVTGTQTAVAQHACCPHLHQQSTPAPGQENWGVPPLPQNHRCCFVQNPQIPSNMPKGVRDSATSGLVARFTTTFSLPEVPEINSSLPNSSFPLSSAPLNMVLRI